MHCFAFLYHLSQFGQSEILNLPDALARDAELFTDLFQGLFALAIQAEAVTQNCLLAVGLR